MRVRINGQVWTVADVPQDRGTCGTCTWAERRIEVHPTLRPKMRLATMIHEVLHAADPEMRHRQIEHLEENLARVLWADGWRRTNGG